MPNQREVIPAPMVVIGVCGAVKVCRFIGINSEVPDSITHAHVELQASAGRGALHVR